MYVQSVQTLCDLKKTSPWILQSYLTKKSLNSLQKKKISEVYMFMYMFMYTVWAMIHVWFYCYLLHMPASSYT